MESFRQGFLNYRAERTSILNTDRIMFTLGFIFTPKQVRTPENRCFGFTVLGHMEMHYFYIELTLW